MFQEPWLLKATRACLSSSDPGATYQNIMLTCSKVSSGVWTGAYSLETAHNLVEVGGGTVTQRSELERIGYLGTMEANYQTNPIGAHFEVGSICHGDMHIHGESSTVF